MLIKNSWIRETLKIAGLRRSAPVRAGLRRSVPVCAGLRRSAPVEKKFFRRTIELFFFILDTSQCHLVGLINKIYFNKEFSSKSTFKDRLFLRPPLEKLYCERFFDKIRYFCNFFIKHTHSLI